MAILKAPCSGVLVVLLMQSILTATSTKGAVEWSPRIVTNKKDTFTFAKNWTQTTGAKVQVVGESEATALSNTITGTGIVAQISSWTNSAAAVADSGGEPLAFNQVVAASEQNELRGRGRRGGRRGGGGDTPDWMVYVALAFLGAVAIFVGCYVRATYKANQKRKEDLQRWKRDMIEFARCGSADSPEVAVPMLGSWRAAFSTVTTNSVQDERPDLTYEYQVFQFNPDGTVRGRGRLCADENAEEAAFNLGGKYNATTREVVWCESFVNPNVFGGEKLVKGTYEEYQVKGTWLLGDGYSGTFVMQQVGVFQEAPSEAASGAIEMSTIQYQPPTGPAVQAKLTVC